MDTAGVEPLVVLRDETARGVEEREVGMGDEEIGRALRGEVAVGRRGRVVSVGRRGEGKDEEVVPTRVDDGYGGKWDPLMRAGRTVGRYIVVDTARD